MFLVVPADTRVEGLVRVGDGVLLLTLGGFEPFQFLIVPDSENQVLLDHEQDLNYADSVDSLLG